jgi:hypothetical protein
MDTITIVKHQPHMDLQRKAAFMKKSASDKRKLAKRHEAEAAEFVREAEAMEAEAAEYLDAAKTLAKAMGLEFYPWKES